MKISNKYGLAKPTCRALRAIMDLYDGGEADYSATTLIKPPRMVQLEHRHWDEIEADVTRFVWSVWGTIGHEIITKYGIRRPSKRLYMKCLDRVIGGLDDYYDSETKMILDYKFTKLNALSYEDIFDDWAKQLNTYALLYRVNGLEVESLCIEAWIRDWEDYKAYKDPNYPQSPIVHLDIPLWPEYVQTQYLHDRVQAHKEAEELPDNELPECTPRECWEIAAGYAVYARQKGAGKALRVLPTLEEAEEWGKQWIEDVLRAKKFKRRPMLYWEYRPGERIRCQRHCLVANFCNQYKEWREYKNGFVGSSYRGEKISRVRKTLRI